MEKKPQTFANHVKYDPQFHFFLLPVLLINVIVFAIQIYRFPGFASAWLFIISFALLALLGMVRGYATRLQDRIIRVEERLRLHSILTEPLRSRIGELEDSQIVGLRFASDAELPALVQRALNEKLSRADIKKAITNWRPDYSRV
jgi:hypothetical protein